MLNEKEKRIFWIVILATAVVSLITAVIGGWLSWMMDLIEDKGVGSYSGADLDFAMTTLLLAMGTVSIFLFFFNKSKCDLANFIVFGCEMALTIIMAAYWYSKRSFSAGAAFLAIGLAISISAMFVSLASYLLAKNKEKTQDGQKEAE